MLFLLLFNLPSGFSLALLLNLLQSHLGLTCVLLPRFFLPLQGLLQLSHARVVFLLCQREYFDDLSVFLSQFRAFIEASAAFGLQRRLRLPERFLAAQLNLIVVFSPT